jgi:hypothetical protein
MDGWNCPAGSEQAGADFPASAIFEKEKDELILGSLHLKYAMHNYLV